MTTFSPLLRIELIGAGGQVNSWGDTTNVNLGTLIEQAIAGAVTIALADADVTLTRIDGQSDQSRNAMLLVTGNQSQTRTIRIPNSSKLYLVRNSTSGGLGVRLQRTGGGGFVEVPNGKTAVVFSDGTDVATAVQYVLNAAIQGGTITNLATPLAVDSGGTGANTADLARINLQAAKSGINSDISGLTGLLTPLSIASGGTSASNAAAARTNLSAARSGVNNDITQLTGLTTVLTLAQGGTGGDLTGSPGALVVAGASSLGRSDVGTEGQFLRSRGTLPPQFVNLSSAVSLIVDGSGALFSNGVKGYLQIPFAAQITAVTLLADVTGSVVVDVWKDTYSNFPPTAADSICGASKPTITAGTKYTDSTLTGWTTTINAGDIIAFAIDSVASITRLTISLTIVRT
jgi:hypothetical protein